MSDEAPYHIDYLPDALKDLKRLEKTITTRIIEKIKRLAENAAILPHEKLQGQWAGFCKLRVGDYRVIYTLRELEKQIIIEAVGHRRDIYEE